jgi:hypothetical protein
MTEPLSNASALEPDAVQILTARLHEQIRAHRRRVWNQRAWWATGAATIILLSALTSMPWWMFFVIGGGGMVKAVSEGAEAAGLLADTDDPRAVVPLAVAARDGDRWTRQAAMHGLMNLLPRLRASDAAAITPDGMRALLGLLRSRESETVIAVLGALRQVGDARALPVVRELARQSGDWIWLDNAYYPNAVAAAAQECLPYLEERVASGNLLRPMEGEQSLLRPAGAAHSPEEALLRPGVEDAE